MFIFPWFNGGWIYVQDVWDRWQGLNVGMLAFASSATAFSISKYNANKQREREFLAAKAFLPAAYSELTEYFKSSARVLLEGWNASTERVVENCIRHAKPEVGDYLSRILFRLQVHDSRLRSFVEELCGRKGFEPDRYNLIAYMYSLGELQALINKNFEFARNTSEFDPSYLDWESFSNAYANLGIHIELIYVDETFDLEKFTKRGIAR